MKEEVGVQDFEPVQLDLNRCSPALPMEGGFETLRPCACPRRLLSGELCGELFLFRLVRVRLCQEVPSFK